MSTTRNPTYQFYLKFGGATHLVNPIWNKGLSKDYIETKNRSYNQTLKGAIDFFRQDFNLINDAQFDTEFELEIKADKGSGFVFDSIWKFKKTDCQFDDESGQISVQVEPKNIILDYMDKEYDFIELLTPHESLNFIKQPILQIYSSGRSFVSNFIGDNFFEKEVSYPETDDGTLTQDYKFGPSTDIIDVIAVNGVTPTIDVTGSYTENSPNVYELAGPHFLFEAPVNWRLKFSALGLDDIDDFNGVWEDDSFINFTFKGRLTIDNEVYGFFSSLGSSPTGTTLTHVSGGVETATQVFSDVEAVDPNEFTKWHITGTGLVVEYIGESINAPNSDFKFPLFHAVSDASTVTVIREKFYARLLTDLVTIATFPLIDDLTDDSYSRVLPITLTNYLYSTESNATEGKYGKFPTASPINAEKYYEELIPTAGSGIDQTYPLLGGRWFAASWWFYHDGTTRSLQESGGIDRELKHAYKLSEVLSRVLAEIDTGITHIDDEDHSKFLYSTTNPITSEANNTLFITRKSNVLVENYEEPASKAIITLNDINTFLEALNLGWFIDSDNRFIIEHKEWFEKGGSYDYNDVQLDITIIRDSKNRQPIEYGQKKFSYRKLSMPEFIKFSWLDKDIGNAFNGYPIEMLSNHVEGGNTEEINVSKFTSDIDYALANDKTFSNDGYFVMVGNYDGSIYTIPIKEISIGVNQSYKLQNGDLAFINIHDKLWRHNLPSRSVNINQNKVTATSVTKNKIQKISIPMGDIDPYKLIKTSYGDGKIISASVELNTSNAKIELAHETK